MSSRRSDTCRRPRFPCTRPRSYLSALATRARSATGLRPLSERASPIRGRRASCSISGDGGFGWALSELSTARKFGIGLVTVVAFNDQGVRATSAARRPQQFGGRILAQASLLNPDFVNMAESFRRARRAQGDHAGRKPERDCCARQLVADAEPAVQADRRADAGSCPSHFVCCARARYPRFGACVRRRPEGHCGQKVATSRRRVRPRPIASSTRPTSFACASPISA